MFRHFAILIIALTLFSAPAHSAQNISSPGTTSYSCNSETQTCTCTSYDDCEKLAQSGRCDSREKNGCEDTKSGAGSCSCTFKPGETRKTSAGTTSNDVFGALSTNYVCSSEKDLDRCSCMGWEDCRAMKKNECVAGTFKCQPGTFICGCDWRPGPGADTKEGRGSQTLGGAQAGSASRASAGKSSDKPSTSTGSGDYSKLNPGDGSADLPKSRKSGIPDYSKLNPGDGSADRP